jgi:hypothetical protein
VFANPEDRGVKAPPPGKKQVRTSKATVNMEMQMVGLASPSRTTTRINVLEDISQDALPEL